jgi:hypothetical protein
VCVCVCVCVCVRMCVYVCVCTMRQRPGCWLDVYELHDKKSVDC